jgi:hypothetical protein
VSRDEAVVIVLVLAFATLATAHVTIVAGLLARPPRWRGLAALVVAPLAPYWAWQPMRSRAVVWLAAAAVYVLALLLARR